MARAKVYLHWSATPYTWVQPGHYHTIVTGDGKVHRLHDYNVDLHAHTWKRNTNSVGLACACMGGRDPWSTPPTDAQIQAMCKEVARIAKGWGWTAKDITVKNILTHAEAASNRDGRHPHENYGPKAWGGTGERWDFMVLQKNGPDDGGDQLRSHIRSYLTSATGKTLSPGDGPLDNAKKTSLQARGSALDVLIDTNGVTWAKAGDLLERYDIPFDWNPQSRRILLGSADISPRYVEDQVDQNTGLPTFEMSLQNTQSPVILVGLIHNNQAWCRVLEFADELGITASFGPFVLHERLGG